MAARTHAEVHVGLRHAEHPKEGVAHALVVVLASMHQAMLDWPSTRGQGLDDWRHLHEVRPRADNGENAHYALASSRAATGALCAAASSAVSMPRARTV